MTCLKIQLYNVHINPAVYVYVNEKINKISNFNKK